MKFLKMLSTMLIAIWCASCSIQSDNLLADPMGAGDPIEGFPQAGTFKLEVFDRDRNAYKPFATLTGETAVGGTRYILTFDDGTPTRLGLQAKEMSRGNYLVRYSQLSSDRPASLSASALAFVTVKDDSYFVLNAITTMDTLNEIFAGQKLPRGGDGADVWLDTPEQAQAVSDWFAKNYPRLDAYKDFSRFRIAR